MDQAAIDGGIYALPGSNVMYGIYCNKTLMEEHSWELPANFAGMEALCAEIKAAGLESGYITVSCLSRHFRSTEVFF